MSQVGRNAQHVAHRCIYCGAQKDITREHIFGDWLKSHVRTNSIRTEHLVSRVGPRGGQIVSMGTGRNHNTGAPHRRQLKIACRACNTGWLSDIHEAAKPALMRLLVDDWPRFEAPECLAVSRYVAMVVMNLEFSDPPTARISSGDRLAFKATGQPPENSVILVGRCLAPLDVGDFWHRSGGLMRQGQWTGENVQTTTFIFGRAFFHMIGPSASLVPDPDEYAAALGIRRIWPQPRQPVTRPLIFNAVGIERVASEYWAQLGLSRSPHHEGRYWAIDA